MKRYVVNPHWYSSFKAYAERHNKTATANRIIVKGEVRAFSTDIYIVEARLLIEAKGSADRIFVRMAIGQLADYRHHLREEFGAVRCAILLPERPSQDLLDNLS